MDWAQEEGARLVRRWCEGYLTHPVIEDELAALGEIVATALRAARRAALEETKQEVARLLAGQAGSTAASRHKRAALKVAIDSIRALLTPEDTNG